MLRLATVLLVPLLLGADYRPRDVRTCRLGGRSRMCQSVGQAGGGGAPPALFTFLPPNGSGAPAMDPNGICEAFASELVGNYTCMRGNGTFQTAPGVTMSKTGTPTTTQYRVCPNGANCDPLAAQTMDAAEWWASDKDVTAGDFSACALGRIKEENGNALVQWNAGQYLNVQSNAATFKVAGVGPAFTLSMTHGRWIFACGTYVRVGAGTSIGKIYVDGVAGPAASTLPLASSSPVKFGSDVASPYDIAFALYTEKELSAATIAAMSQKVFGTLTAANGSAVTQTRTSVMHCDDNQGRLVVLPGARPCIGGLPGYMGPLIYLEGSVTNVLLQSEALETWTSSAATATVNTTAAPTSVIAAETLQDDATTAEHLVARTTVLTASGPHQVSAFFKAGTKAIGVIKYATAQYGFIDATTGSATTTGTGATARSIGYANGWWRLILTIAAGSTTANPAIGIGMANVAGAPSYAGDATGTIVAWGAQLEFSNMPTSYIRTGGSATTRTASTITVPVPVGVTNAAGCVGAVGQIQSFVAGSSFNTFVGLSTGLERLSVGSTSTTNACSDGTLTNSTASPDFLTAPRRSQCSWDGGTLTATTETNINNTAYDGALLGSTITIGAAGSVAVPLVGWVGNVKLGDNVNACQ